MQLLKATQMRAIEIAAMNAGVVTGLELMERAGRGVVEAVHEWRPELAASPGDAVVLCGPGNNDGDGFVIARLLKGAGWNVRVSFLGDAERLPPDAATNYQRWREMGDVSLWGPLPAADLYIDALFGGGLSRPLPDAVRQCLMSDISQRTIAVDGPSGLCLDSGRPLGFALPAGATCTFQAERRGNRLGDGPDLCGALFVKDIGLGDYLEPDVLAELLTEQPTQLAQPATLTLSKAHAGHKYSHGHALVLAGGVGKGGTAGWPHGAR